jgi:peptidoglycan/LPS O-acetylase OafA/YrhL
MESKIMSEAYRKNAPPVAAKANRAYKPHVDGLRAVAVLSVIFFHAEISIYGFHIFRGGFVGVDIFFVISGYLITKILIAEIESGCFSFINFYERRARRILPAFFVTAFVSIPFAWMFMLSLQLKGFAQSIVASSLYLSNLLFWFRNAYFAEPSQLVPLLHTWSLAVEEQYYLLYPPLILWLFRRKAWSVGSVLILIAIASLLAAEIVSRFHAQTAFYLIPCRAWELAIGSLAGYYSMQRPELVQLNRAQSEILSFTGLLMIVVSIGLFDETTRTSSALIALPVFGAGILVWSTDRHCTMASKALSIRPLVVIGLISYSTYLYHQPIFAFARLSIVGDMSASVALGLIVLSVLFGYLSWRYIERPFRTPNQVSSSILWKGVASCTVLLLVIGVVINYGDGFPNRFITLATADAAAKQGPFLLNGVRCINRPITSSCEYEGENNTHQHWVLVGDSHMGSLLESFDRALRERKESYLVLAKASCPFVIGMEHRYANSSVRNGCRQYNYDRLEKLSRLPPSNVVIFARLSMYTMGEPFNNAEGTVEKGSERLEPPDYNGSEEERRKAVKDAITNSIKTILAMGHHVLLIYPLPEVGFQVPQTIYKAYWHGLKGDLSTPEKVFFDRTRIAYKALDEVGQSPNVARVYPAQLLCNNYQVGRCVVQHGGEVYYTDNNHPSLILSDRIVSEIISSKQREAQ